MILFEKKEAFKSDDEKGEQKRNSIPKKMRILMRKKTNISKKIVTSNSPTKTLRLLKELEVIEAELTINYKSMRLKKENKALAKIKRDPKYFYKYVNSFSKTKNKVSPLNNVDGETEKDPYLMAEILRKQYSSTFSTPDPDFNLDNLGEDFFKEEENNDEKKNGEIETEEETEVNNDASTEQEPVNTKPPQLTNAHFNYTDIEDAID